MIFDHHSILLRSLVDDIYHKKYSKKVLSGTWFRIAPSVNPMTPSRMKKLIWSCAFVSICDPAVCNRALKSGDHSGEKPKTTYLQSKDVSEVSKNSWSRKFSTRVSFIFSRSTTRNDFHKSRSRLETWEQQYVISFSSRNTRMIIW